MPSKTYLNYKPLIEEAKADKETKDTSGFVTKDIFELQFGFTYPKSYTPSPILKTYKYPKTNESNGKNSRFR